MADAEDYDGPAERDVPVEEFIFKQMCKLKVFDGEPETLTPKDAVHLIAVSNKYGFTFIGCDTGVKVIRTSDLSRLDADNDSNSIVQDVACVQKVVLPVMPCHVALSSDNLTLSVCYQQSTAIRADFFDVRSLVDPSKNLKPFATEKLTDGGDVSLRDLCWNPDCTESAGIFAVCLTNGSMSLWQVNATVIKLHSLGADVGINAICWSPKGKQIVCGTLEGKLVQYSKSLEVKKQIEAPNIFDNDLNIQVISVLWLSTYCFLAAYNAIESTEQPNLVEVTTTKTGSTTFVNLEDVCFGGGEDRDPVYYFIHLPDWQLIVTAQSNAMECVAVGKKQSGGWERWNLDDAGRVEMPLHDSEETYPMGVALDLTSQVRIPIAENQTLPPAPIFMSLSTEGFLCPFYMVNRTEVKTIVSAPQQLNPDGVRQPQEAATPCKTTVGNIPSFAQLTPQTSSKTTDESLHIPTPRGNLLAKFESEATPKASGSHTIPLSSSTPALTGVFSKPGDASVSTAFSFAAPVQAGKVPSSTSMTGGAKFDFSGANKPATSSAATTFSFGGFPATQRPPSTKDTAQQPGVTSTSQPIGQFQPGVTSTSQPIGQFQPGVTSTSQPIGQFQPGVTSTSQPIGQFQPGVTSTSQPIGQFQPGVTSASQPIGQFQPGVTSASQPIGQFQPGVTSASQPIGQSQPVGGSTGHTISQSKSTSALYSFGQSGATALSGKSQPAFSSNSSTSAFSATVVGGSEGGIFGGSSGQTLSFAGIGKQNSQPQARGTFQITTDTSQAANKPVGTAGIGSIPSSVQQAAMPAMPKQSPTINTGGITSKPVTFGTTTTANTKPTALPSTTNKPTVLPSTTKPMDAPVSSKPVYFASQQGTDVSGIKPELKPASTAASAHPSVASRIQQPQGKPSPSTSVESSINAIILDEMSRFQRELDELKGRTVDFVVGADAEKRELLKGKEDLAEFHSEITDCVQSQNEDISELKSLTLNAAVLVEEGKIRSLRNIDPHYRQLLRSRPLDPASGNKMKDINKLYQYLDNGVKEVNAVLDEQWEVYQDKQRSGARKLQSPATDTVYHVISNNHNLIQNESRRLQELKEQLQKLKLYNSTSSWTSSYKQRDSELSSLAASLRETKLMPSSKLTRTPVSGKKQTQLREILSQRQMTPTRSRAQGSPSIISPEYLRHRARTSPLDRLAEDDASHSDTGINIKLQPIFSAAVSEESRPEQSGPVESTTQMTKPVFTVSKTSSASSAAPWTSMIRPPATATTMSVHVGLPRSVMSAPNLQKIPVATSQADKPASTAAQTQQEPVPLTQMPRKSQKISSPLLQQMGMLGPLTAPPSQNSAVSKPTSTLPSAQKAALIPPPISHSTPQGIDAKQQHHTPSTFPAQVTATAKQKPLFTASPLPTLQSGTTAATSSFVTTGSGTVVWGSSPSTKVEMLPKEAAARAAMERQAATASQSRAEAREQDKIPPVVNIKNIDTKGATGNMTIAEVDSSQVDAGTAKVVSEVLAEIAATSVKTPAESTTNETEFVASAVSSLKTPSPSVSTSISTTTTTTTTTGPGFMFGIQNTTPSISTSRVPSSGNGFSFKTSSSAPNFLSKANETSDNKDGKDEARKDPDENQTSSSNVDSVPKPGAFFFTDASSVGKTSSGTALQSGSDKPFAAAITKPLTVTTSSVSGTADVAPGTTTVMPTNTTGLDSTGKVSGPLSMSSLLSKPVPPDSESTLGTTADVAASVAATTSETATTTQSTVAAIPATTPTTMTISEPTKPAAKVTASNATTSVGVSDLGNVVSQESASSEANILHSTKTAPSATQGTPSNTAATTLAAATGSVFRQTSSSADGQSETGGGLFGSTVGGVALPSSQSIKPVASSSTTTPPSGLSLSSTSGVSQTTTSNTGFGSFFSQPTSTTSSGLFGQSATATSKPSIFGQSTSTSSSSGLFGQTAETTSSGGLFGRQAATTSQGGLFGQTTSTSGGGGLFGQATTSSGLFGSGTSTFSQAPSGSLFGQQLPATASAGFGQPSTLSSGSFLGAGSGMFSGLGGKPSTEAANKNPFGNAPTSSFGNASESSVVFGSGGAKSFGDSGQGSFSGSFSAASTGGVGTAGFGAVQNPQQTGATSGFGGSAAFGGSPSFGSPPAFGSQPVFGSSSPTFPNTATSGSVFGASSTMASGFASLANSNTSPTFGGLAAQSPAAPTFGSLTAQQDQPAGFGSAASNFGSPAAFGGSPSFGGGSPAFGGGDQSKQQFSSWR